MQITIEIQDYFHRYHEPIADRYSESDLEPVEWKYNKQRTIEKQKNQKVIETYVQSASKNDKVQYNWFAAFESKLD